MSIPHSDTAYIGKFGVRIDQIIEAVRSRVPGWARAVDEGLGLPLEPSGGIATASSASHDHVGFHITPLTGGMSNLMYMVECTTASAPEDGSAPVARAVARILSPALDAAIDRVREMKVVSFLSHTGIGPRLFGTVRMETSMPPRTLLLRVEEFVPGRTLAVSDLRLGLGNGLAGRMAVKVGDLHASRPNLNAAVARTLSTGSVGSSTPTPLHDCDTVPEPGLPEALRGYLNLIQNLTARAAVTGSHLPTALKRLMALADWPAVSRWLCELMALRGGGVVLAHGDLQEGNWIAQPDGRLVLIDYEYSRYDYAGFDLGNLNCEHAFDYAVGSHPGFTFTPEAYPDLDWQRAFLAAYAARLGVRSGEAGVGGGDNLTCREDVLVSQFGSDLAPIAAAARVGVLASHLYWSMWSIIMAGGKAGVPCDMLTSEEAEAYIALRDLPPRAVTPVRAHTPSASVASGHVVFDYAEYGLVRAREFMRLRDKYLDEHPEDAR